MTATKRISVNRIVLSAIVFLCGSSLLVFAIYTHLDVYRDATPINYDIPIPTQTHPTINVIDHDVKDKSSPSSSSSLSAASTPTNNVATKPRLQSCNPFLLPGYIDVKKQSWTPLYSQCPIVTWSMALSMRKSLRGKKYYFYGDSSMRYIVFDFCQKIGASALEAIPNPANYHITNEQAAIEYCHIESLNFTAISVFTFGLAEWDQRQAPFLTAHKNHNLNNNDNNGVLSVNPSDWKFEDRMKTPNAMLIERFGVASMVFLSSGLWDLYHLQQYMTYPKSRIIQTVEAPTMYLKNLALRWKGYIDMARLLHANSQIYIIDLSDPARFDVAKNFGLEGYDYVAEHSCLSEVRLRAFREVTKAVVMEEKWAGKMDVDVLPYDLYTRAAPSEKRMRDVVHPSAYVNGILSAALIWVSKIYDEK